MTYSEWLITQAPIDRLVAAALPPLSELEKLSFNAILDKHSNTILRTAKALGIDLTDAEVEKVMERIVGARAVFRRGHCHLHP